MSNLDKNYMLKLDLVEEIKNDEMQFSLSDTGTSVFYITITRNEEKIDLDLKNSKVTFYVMKPDKTYDNTDLKFDSEDKELFRCELTESFKNKVGQYIGQIVILDSTTQERIIVPSRIYYTVNVDILAEMMGLV